MGEVRVPVKLTNTHDVAASFAGHLPPEKVRAIEVEALVDTGATRSVVPATVLQELGITAYDTAMAELADGRTQEVGMAEGIRFSILGRNSSDDALVLGDEVLVGQTLLEKMDLLVDCKQQRLIPNPAHPNYPVTKVKTIRLDQVGHHHHENFRH